MAQFLQRILGGQAPSPASPAAPLEDDFADFASAPDPTPISILDDAPSATATPSPSSSSSPFGTPSFGGANFNALPRPYTKWYRVHERVYLQDFYAEMFILPFIILVIGLHLWGTRKNKRKAKGWIAAHGPVLQREFASVGFTGVKTSFSDVEFGGEGGLNEAALKMRAGNEFIAYATGRANVAFVDIKLTLAKRYNPFMQASEAAMGFLFESMPAPRERMEATCFVFDGREGALVPSLLKSGSEAKAGASSSYDGFVWAIVHKEAMKVLRDGRYDLSLTTTRDHAKLPDWASVMSENAEITETLLTGELQKAVESAGELLEALIISDQPVDQPKTLNEAIPKKRISLALRLPSGTSAADYAPVIPLFTYFLRLADILTEKGRFRPDALRRVRATREEEIKKIKKVDESEKNEDRRLKLEKEKKVARDEKLKGMTDQQQKKFLEKERAQEMRKSQKGRSVR